MRVGNLKIMWNYNGNQTNCRVVTLENQEVANASIKKFITDVPNKRVARKIAFSRTMAMISAGNLLPKSTRADIWNAFREEIRQPEPQK